MQKAMGGVYIIGMGAVGAGLAKTFIARDVALAGLWNRGAQGAQRAAAFLGRTVDHGEFGEALADAEVVLLCVSDSAVAEVADKLRVFTALRRDAVIAHVSGCLTHDSLGEFGGRGRASLHPLAACPNAEAAARVLPTAHYVFEGDDGALSRLRPLVAAIGADMQTIATTAKARYHGAAVMASNLLVALLESAVDEAAAAGLPDGRRALLDLAAGALERLRETDGPNALTGPIRRGDAATVAQNLAALSPEARAVYRVLSVKALQLAKQAGLAAEHARALEALLADG